MFGAAPNFTVKGDLSPSYGVDGNRDLVSSPSLGISVIYICLVSYIHAYMRACRRVKIYMYIFVPECLSCKLDQTEGRKGCRLLKWIWYRAL